MADRRLRILQVNSSDIGGGAQKVAWNLFQSYRRLGYVSCLAVGHKQSDDPDVLPISNGEGRPVWSRFFWSMHSALQSLDGNGWLSRLAHKLAEPGAFLDGYYGIEDFRFPESWRLLRLTVYPPDILHCHNLHIGYFDLRALSWLSHQVPTVLTLHDAWLLSGHCAHSFDCERWKIGCGQCPDLTIYPAVRRDATDFNWQRKQQIFEKSRLYVATPSRWLMQKLEQSMLAPGVVEARVIPNGVDLTLFHPRDRNEARASLALPQEARILLFTANGIRANIWKDYRTLRGAIGQVATRLHGQSVLFIALGEGGSGKRIDQAEVRFIPYQKAPEAVARYYQAANVYIHAARADTFPNTILEALACGTPVVATAVGGIPEQVKGLRIADGDGYGPDEATGALVPQGDAKGLADGIERLLTDETLCERLARNAATDAKKRFNLEHQVESYLVWYKELLAGSEQHRFRPSVAPTTI